MEFLFLLLCILAIINLGIGAKEDSFGGFIAGVAFSFCVAGAIGCGVKLWCEPLPTALDVYNGKTTLEITYRDSVAVDSVVVFKEETK